jgi:hypothetical protein
MLIVSSLALGGVLLLSFAGFPGWLKIAMARLGGAQYVIKVTRDNKLTIEGAQEREGIFKTKTGAYELEPEDSFIFNGCSSALWYAPYNQAVLLKIMPLLHDLKIFGIDNYGQLLYFYNTPLETIAQDLGETAALQAKKLQGYEGKILQDLEIVRIPDLKNFLEARSPSAENGIIERYVQIERRKFNNPLKNGNVLLLLVMAALLGLCAGYIIAGNAGGSPALQAISNVGSNLTPV